MPCLILPERNSDSAFGQTADRGDAFRIVRAFWA